MPGFTPNFAIQYPCAGETINPTVFQAFADDVEAALATVDAAATAALNRPSAAIRDSGTSIPFGAMAALSFDSTDFTTPASISVGATGFTVLEPGVYMVTLEAGSDTVPTTVTSWSAEILVAGTVIWRRKLSQPGAPSTPPAPFSDDLNLAGLAVVTAGQLVSFQWGWTGTGINMAVTARATINKISDL